MFAGYLMCRRKKEAETFWHKSWIRWCWNIGI